MPEPDAEDIPGTFAHSAKQVRLAAASIWDEMTRPLRGLLEFITYGKKPSKVRTFRDGVETTPASGPVLMGWGVDSPMRAEVDAKVLERIKQVPMTRFTFPVPMLHEPEPERDPFGTHSGGGAIDVSPWGAAETFINAVRSMGRAMQLDPLTCPLDLLGPPPVAQALGLTGITESVNPILTTLRREYAIAGRWYFDGLCKPIRFGGGHRA